MLFRSNHDTGSLTDLLRPAADGVLTLYEVSTEVNRVQHDGPSLLAAIGGDGGSNGAA